MQTALPLEEYTERRNEQSQIQIHILNSCLTCIVLVAIGRMAAMCCKLQLKSHNSKLFLILQRTALAFFMNLSKKFSWIFPKFSKLININFEPNIGQPSLFLCGYLRFFFELKTQPRWQRGFYGTLRRKLWTIGNPCPVPSSGRTPLLPTFCNFFLHFYRFRCPRKTGPALPGHGLWVLLFSPWPTGISHHHSLFCHIIRAASLKCVRVWKKKKQPRNGGVCHAFD